MRTEHERPVDGMEDVRLVYASTGVHGGGAMAGVGLAYHRPVRVVLTGSGAIIPIRDHVMEARLALVVAFLLMIVLRLGR
jgi:hypothetical protein